jgi:hypothetical protein
MPSSPPVIAAALQALQRGLPHYGKQSWLVFEGTRAQDKGIWPAQVERRLVTGAQISLADFDCPAFVMRATC